MLNYVSLASDQAKGGWKNNPNCLQLKCALRKMLQQNAINASKNASCQEFASSSTLVIEFCHSKKHNAPLDETKDERSIDENDSNITFEDLLCAQIDAPNTIKFLANILFYIAGYIPSIESYPRKYPAFPTIAALYPN